MAIHSCGAEDCQYPGHPPLKDQPPNRLLSKPEPEFQGTEKSREFDMHLRIRFFGKQEHGERLRKFILYILTRERGIDVEEINPPERYEGTSDAE